MSLSRAEFGNPEREFLNLHDGEDSLGIEVGYYLEANTFSPTADEARAIGERLIAWADKQGR
jgi:hypothetical protein